MITESLEGEDVLNLTSERVELLSKFKFSWDTEESDLIPNITIIMFRLLCIDHIGIEKMHTVLENWTLAPMEIQGRRYYSFTSIPILSGAINHKSSKITYFSTGDIMDIVKPVFNDGDYPLIFKIEEADGTLFCTDVLCDAILAHNLTGVKFTECKVKSKSRFNIF